eukprot:9049908-Karenia_brevis.AAC.1
MKQQHDAEAARQQQSFQDAMDNFRNESESQAAREREERERSLIQEAKRRHTEKWQAAQSAMEQQRLEMESSRRMIAEKDKLVQQKDD